MDHPHPAFSWGKDLTGGPSPRAPSPGFLCSQRRPENRPGHDEAPRPQHLASLSSPRVSWRPRWLPPLSPTPAAGEGKPGPVSLLCCWSPVVWGESHPDASGFTFSLSFQSTRALGSALLPSASICHLSPSQNPTDITQLLPSSQNTQTLPCTHSPCALKPEIHFCLKLPSSVGFAASPAARGRAEASCFSWQSSQTVFLDKGLRGWASI